MKGTKSPQVSGTRVSSTCSASVTGKAAGIWLCVAIPEAKQTLISYDWLRSSSLFIKKWSLTHWCWFILDLLLDFHFPLIDESFPNWAEAKRSYFVVEMERNNFIKKIFFRLNNLIIQTRKQDKSFIYFIYKIYYIF